MANMIVRFQIKKWSVPYCIMYSILRSLKNFFYFSSLTKKSKDFLSVQIKFDWLEYYLARVCFWRKLSFDSSCKCNSFLLILNWLWPCWLSQPKIHFLPTQTLVPIPINKNVDFFPFLGLPLIVVGIWSSLTYYLQPDRLQYSSGTNDYIDSIVDMNRSNEYDAAASTSAAESALHSELKFQTSPIH